MKHTAEKDKGLVTMSVKVDADLRDAFADVAESEFRPMAAELWMLIAAHVKNYRASSRARGDKKEA